MRPVFLCAEAGVCLLTLCAVLYVTLLVYNRGGMLSYSNLAGDGALSTLVALGPVGLTKGVLPQQQYIDSY